MTDGHMQRVLISFMHLIRLDVPTPTNENVLSLSCSVHYIGLISVDHDDLPDGGSGHFAETKATKVNKWFSLLHIII